MSIQDIEKIMYDLYGGCHTDREQTERTNLAIALHQAGYRKAPTKSEIAKEIYYTENPHFRQYTETRWENYPSEDKGGYFKLATAISQLMEGE